jgi:hypothetical protein
MVDMEAVRERLREWRQERTVPMWRERIRRVVLDETEPPVLRRSADFRVLITPAEARLQVHFSDEEKFRPVGNSELNDLGEAQAQGALILPAEAELLLLSSLSQIIPSQSDVCRFDLESHGGWLGSLFEQPALATRLVTLDEAPFRRSEDTLIWQGREDVESMQLHLTLITSDGVPAPLPLRMMHGARTLYLTSDTLFVGPRWFPEETRMETPVTIPLNALATQDGIAFLERIDVPLPDHISSRVRHEALSVELRANCLPRVGNSGAEFTIFKAEATGADGRVLKDGLDGVGGLVKLATVTVTGKVAEGSSADSLVVNATAIQVK